MMKLRFATKLTTALILAIFVTCAPVISSLGPTVSAATFAAQCGGGVVEYGRNGCHGYFSNTNYYPVTSNSILSQYPGSTRAFPDSALSAAPFEAVLKAYVARTNNGTVYDYDGVDSAFIIDTMLGVTGPNLCKWYTGGASTTCNWKAGVAYALANMTDWENRVNYYDTQGWIEWWKTVNYPVGTIDTTHICGQAGGACSGVQPKTSSPLDPKDVVFRKEATAYTLITIVFHNPNGSTYNLIRLCGNTVGNSQALAKPPVASASAACAGVISSIVAPDPKQAFNLTASVSFNPSAAAAADFGPDTMSITFNGATKSTKSPTISGGLARLTMAVPATNKTGVLLVTWNVSGPQAPTVSCSDDITIADEPYFTVPNGDVQAGAPMGLNAPMGGTDCSTIGADYDAGIVSWNQEIDGNYAGAGTGYAAFALSYLQDFASAQGSTTGNAKQPTGLSFSNRSFNGPDGNKNVDLSGSGNDTYGGNYGLESCMPNFVAKLGTPKPVGTPVPAPNPSGNVTFYVKGDVFLTSNVAIFGGSYVNLGKIPSYAIVTTGGNIYISGSVTRLDGLYVSEPDGTGIGGNIYTCTTVPSAALQNGDTNLTIDLANYYTDCKNPLTVNGSFVARQVWLLRTGGTLYGGTPTEKFNFAPEVWLGLPLGTKTGGSGVSKQYDAITSLAPTL
jgi:hypothetical protein